MLNVSSYLLSAIWASNHDVSANDTLANGSDNAFAIKRLCGRDIELARVWKEQKCLAFTCVPLKFIAMARAIV